MRNQEIIFSDLVTGSMFKDEELNNHLVESRKTSPFATKLFGKRPHSTWTLKNAVPGHATAGSNTKSGTPPGFFYSWLY